MRTFKNLTKNDRYRLEALLLAKTPVVEIARILHVHRSTIYREMKRCTYVHTNSDLTEEVRYNPDGAWEKAKWNRSAGGSQLKIGKDRKLADYIENKIINEKYSPAAVIGEIKAKGLAFDTSISTRTVYRYIDKGVFLELTNKHLPIKANKKRKYKKVQQKKASRGESIENRPAEIEGRENFGHWEMDTVVGKRGKSKKSILVLTERKTRDEIAMLLPNHTAEAVVNAIDRLEKRWGKMFERVFQSITVDNGTEFSDYNGIERSISGTRKRTKVYYCHPYSSSERGSNENTNRLIRRHIPKGVNFDDKTDEDIEKIAQWINEYPRGIFDYKCARQMFESEIEKISLAVV